MSLLLVMELHYVLKVRNCSPLEYWSTYPIPSGVVHTMPSRPVLTNLLNYVIVSVSFQKLCFTSNSVTQLVLNGCNHITFT